MIEMITKYEIYFILMLIFTTICLTFSAIAGILSIVSYIKVQAFEKSTHQIQYVPVDPDIEKENEEYLKNSDASWATDSTVLEKDREEYLKDLKETGMDFFVPSDEDKKIRSF